ncbi:MAG: hypothetical protein LUE89_02315 [Clostridiales bacterium]|nr:hypothetical protein [Clostridiales bacterium]
MSSFATAFFSFERLNAPARPTTKRMADREKHTWNRIISLSPFTPIFYAQSKGAHAGFAASIYSTTFACRLHRLFPFDGTFEYSVPYRHRQQQSVKSVSVAQKHRQNCPRRRQRMATPHNCKKSYAVCRICQMAFFS